MFRFVHFVLFLLVIDEWMLAGHSGLFHVSRFTFHALSSLQPLRFVAPNT